MLTKVIKFSAPWCNSCKILEPKFKEISKKFERIKFEEIDIDKNPDAAELYLIRSLPTTILIDENEKILERIVGNNPEKIELSIINYIKSFKI